MIGPINGTFSKKIDDDILAAHCQVFGQEDSEGFIYEKLYTQKKIKIITPIPLVETT